MISRPLVAAFAFFLAACSAAAPATSTFDKGVVALARGRDTEAHALFQRVVRESPDTDDSALALDYLLDLSGMRALPEKNYDCSRKARDAALRGQSLRLSGKLTEAIAEYARSSELCPANLHWIVQSGDVSFSAGDMHAARARYEAALARDPWHREAHSRLGDVLSRQGDGDGALREHVLSVVSDPMYQGGWLHLGKSVRARGGKLLRRYERKPSIGPNGELNLYTDEKGKASEWPAYGFGLLLMPTLLEAKGVKDPTALEFERAIVDHMLKTDQAVEPTSFWSLVRRAKRLGLLDEAIFMGLMDAELGREYPAFRDKHADRLERYVREVAIEWPAARPAGDRVPPATY